MIQANFSSCCGLEWLLNAPFKYVIDPKTVSCYHPFKKTIVYVDDLRGEPICPCIFLNANTNSSRFNRSSADECISSFQWTLVNAECVHTSNCPNGTRPTPLNVGNVYNCTFPDVHHTCTPGLPYVIGYDVACESKISMVL